MSANFDFSRVPSPVFVETGSYRGDGIRQALDAGYAKIHSIDISDHWIQHCCGRFAKEIATGQVTLWKGDSLAVLPDLVASLSQPATFWLDAHSHPHNTGAEKAGVNCPVYEEIAAIAASAIRNHTILIDDLRLITDPRSWGGHEVKLSGMIERLRAINPDYAFNFFHGLIAHDVLVARVDPTWHSDQDRLEALLLDPLSHSISAARQSLAWKPPRFMRYRFLVTRLLHRAGPAVMDFAEALHVAREAAVHWPQHAPAHELVSRAAFALGRQALMEGKSAAEMAFELRPSNPQIAKRLNQLASLAEQCWRIDA